MDFREKQRKQEKVIKESKELKNGGKQTTGYGQLKARLYGFSKVRKVVVPLRPALSMPGSVYHSIAEQDEECLNAVPQ